ncbi:MAG: PqqD family protein [Chloroflexi bacterium]|nr:PqqD family protein [Chloroflexota bacterium]MBI3339537.1 PqqD family protein [Chloroflexota bacterium]
MLVPAPIEGFQIETLDGEIVLLHPARNLIIHSNQTGALIWHLCDGIRTVDEITELLSAAYPDARDEIQADVPAVIQTLISRGALRSK